MMNIASGLSCTGKNSRTKVIQNLQSALFRSKLLHKLYSTWIVDCLSLLKYFSRWRILSPSLRHPALPQGGRVFFAWKYNTSGRLASVSGHLPDRWMAFRGAVSNVTAQALPRSRPPPVGGVPRGP